MTSAVHLEVVPNMTMEAFLRSFKRFAARRGFPNRVLSDNGKTFKVAQRALVKLVAQPVLLRYPHQVDVQSGEGSLVGRNVREVGEVYEVMSQECSRQRQVNTRQITKSGAGS